MSAAAGPVLRDIHLPAEPGWWPPAPGWWVVTAIAVLTLAWLAWRWRRQARARRARSALHAAFERIRAEHASDPAAQVAGYSELLRRAARRHAPQALALRGEAWLEFLDAGDATAPFRQGPGRQLLDAPYRPRVAAAEAEALADVVRARLDRFVEAAHG